MSGVGRNGAVVCKPYIIIQTYESVPDMRQRLPHFWHCLAVFSSRHYSHRHTHKEKCPQNRVIYISCKLVFQLHFTVELHSSLVNFQKAYKSPFTFSLYTVVSFLSHLSKKKEKEITFFTHIRIVFVVATGVCVCVSALHITEHCS